MVLSNVHHQVKVKQSLWKVQDVNSLVAQKMKDPSTSQTVAQAQEALFHE